MENCMDRCASERPLCYGAAFNYQTGICWFKGESFVYNSSVATKANDTNLAVAARQELKPFDTDCQYHNGTIQQQNGLNFTIHCNQDILGADYCAQYSLDCKFHADSLQECMNICTQALSQCSGVAYNPDMMHGFGNCYPKFNLTQGFIPTGGSIDDGAITHSAVAHYNTIPYNCTSNAVIAAGTGQGYTTSCGQDSPGNDITKYHSENITNCITSCSKWSGTGSCFAVVFDTNMTNGFENCYLKSSVSAPITADKGGFILAMQGGAVSSSTSSSSTSASSTGTSQAQATSSGASGVSVIDGAGTSGLSGGAIAGIVIGVLALIAIVAVVAFLLLRRRRAAAAAASSSPEQAEALAPPYTGPPAPPPVAETSQTPSQSTLGYGQIDHKYAPQPQAHPVPADALWQGGQQPYADGRAFEMEDQARVELPVTKAVDRVELPASYPRS